MLSERVVLVLGRKFHNSALSALSAAQLALHLFTLGGRRAAAISAAQEPWEALWESPGALFLGVSVEIADFASWEALGLICLVLVYRVGELNCYKRSAYCHNGRDQ